MQVPRPMPQGGEGKTTRGSRTPMRTCRRDSRGKERKQGEPKGKPTNKQTNKKLLCDDVKMSGCGISSIPKSSVHAMRHEWLGTGWACGHSGQPPFVLSRVNHSWMQKNVRNVNDAPYGWVWKNRSWQEQVKKIRRSTTDGKKEVKVSRRVPTAVPLLLMMSTVKKKERKHTANPK